MKDEEENKLTDDIIEVFEYYRRVIGKRVRFTPTKIKKIRARLKSFSKEELFRAIDNISKSPFHNGVNDRGQCYNSIEFLFRSDDKTEEWVERYDKPSNGHVRLLGEALIENYKISYQRYLHGPVILNVEDEQAFYSCAQRILDAGYDQYHVPQAFMLAFFLLDYKDDKSVSGFVYRLPWLLAISPVCRERALSFTRQLLKKQGVTALPASTDEAVRILEKSGLTYD